MCCLQQFLAQNNLRLIIRSHEGPDARHKRAAAEAMPSIHSGYSVDHEGPGKAALGGCSAGVSVVSAGLHEPLL